MKNIQNLTKYLFILISTICLSCSNNNDDNEDETTIIKNNQNNFKKEKENIGENSVSFNKKYSGIPNQNQIDKNISKNQDGQNENTMEVAFSKNFPNNRIMFPGLNIEGKCVNPKCQGKDKFSWSPIKYFRGILKDGEIINECKNKISDKIEINVNLGEEMRLACCPLCNNYLREIKAYGFSRSKAQIERIIDNKKEIENIDTSLEPSFFVYKPVEGPPDFYKDKNIKININLNSNN